MGKESIDVMTLQDNVSRQWHKQWTLITAAKGDAVNTMTASWGGFGILWSRPIAIIYLRPQRYTREFVDASDYFTLTFFPEKYRPALQLCGAKSGREIDKIRETGLTPVRGAYNEVYFEEANLVMVCKKQFMHHITPDEILSPAMRQEFYPGEDYHYMYFGEIVECLQER